MKNVLFYVFMIAVIGFAFLMYQEGATFPWQR